MGSGNSKPPLTLLLEHELRRPPMPRRW